MNVGPSGGCGEDVEGGERRAGRQQYDRDDAGMKEGGEEAEKAEGKGDCETRVPRRQGLAEQGQLSRGGSELHFGKLFKHAPRAQAGGRCPRHSSSLAELS